VLAARARARERSDVRAALVEEMLVGRPPRALPEPVRTALVQLSAARGASALAD
jgi:hypothetical protein